MNNCNPMGVTQESSLEEQRTDLVQKGTAALDMRMIELAEKAVQLVSPRSPVQIVTQTEGACYACPE